jgi:Type II secretion system (T2SS), protein F
MMVHRISTAAQCRHTMSSSPFSSAVTALMPSPAGTDDAPAVRLLADTLGQASELDASDIHGRAWISHPAAHRRRVARNRAPARTPARCLHHAREGACPARHRRTPRAAGRPTAARLGARQGGGLPRELATDALRRKARAAPPRHAALRPVALAAGTPLADALGSLTRATDNTVFDRASVDIAARLAHGERLAAAMRAARCFPASIVQPIAIAEESGALDAMLLDVATLAEREANEKLALFASLAEPLVVIVLGTLIGGLVVALYLPVIELGNVV